MLAKNFLNHSVHDLIMASTGKGVDMLASGHIRSTFVYSLVCKKPMITRNLATTTITLSLISILLAYLTPSEQNLDIFDSMPNAESRFAPLCGWFHAHLNQH
jgi:hypothetical protein